MKPRHPHRSDGHRPALPRKARQAPPGLPPPIRYRGKCYTFDPEMVAGFADRDGVLLPIGPPLAAMIAACSFKAILSLPGRRQISYLFRVPDVLPPPWPRLASFPDWALRGALEAIVAGKRLPGFR